MPPGFQSNLAVTTTWQRRLNDVSDATVRDRPLLALMQAAGQIKKPDGGEFCQWVIRHKSPKPQGYSDFSPPTYDQPDPFRMAQLNWASYHHGKSLGRNRLSVNQGKYAFIKLFNDMIEDVKRSFTDRWPEYFYQNGDDATEPEPMFGFYSLGDLFIDSTAAADQGFEGKVRLASGEYAGLTVDLGTESAEWRGDDGFDTVQEGPFAGYKWWPEGQGDAGYDYMHPLIVNCTAGEADGAPQSWGPNADLNSTYIEDMIDFGVGYSRRINSGDKGEINMILMGQKPMQTFRKRFSGTYRTLAELLPTKSATASSQGLAFGKPIYNHNGCMLCPDFDIPFSNEMMGFNLMDVEYLPVSAYDANGNLPIMTPHLGPVPGGSGHLIGGFAHGQLIFRKPRGMVFWRRLG
jgi:hypothetical protein